MLYKFLIIVWYISRPKYYPHFISLIKRKFLMKHDTANNKDKAYQWAVANAVTSEEALKMINIKAKVVGLDKDTINKGKELEKKSSFKMGGSGHIHLLYDCVRLIKANVVIETGVAYGWSSLAILKALDSGKGGKLYSIDMPYPTKNNENDVGIVVPDYLKKNWYLIRKPDNPGIIDALKKIGEKIDLCHYDSDKSWWGRHYAFPILWESLKSKGLFISDDIQDNLYFYEFVKGKSVKFAIVKIKEKFVGLILKP